MNCSYLRDKYGIGSLVLMQFKDLNEYELVLGSTEVYYRVIGGRADQEGVARYEDTALDLRNVFDWLPTQEPVKLRDYVSVSMDIRPAGYPTKESDEWKELRRELNGLMKKISEQKFFETVRTDYLPVTVGTDWAEGFEPPCHCRTPSAHEHGCLWMSWRNSR